MAGLALLLVNFRCIARENWSKLMKWYDLVAPLYDIAGTAWYYRLMRQEPVRQLRLAPGQTVLDVACSTGRSDYDARPRFIP